MNCPYHGTPFTICRCFMEEPEYTPEQIKEIIVAARDAMDFLTPRPAMADLRNGSDASAVYRSLKSSLEARKAKKKGKK